MDKKQRNILRVFKIIGNTIFYLFILVLLLFSITNLTTKREDDIPNLFEKGFVNVLSSSMDGELSSSDYKVGSFKKDALVFVKMLKTDEQKSELKVGDVVVFWGQLDPTDPKSKGFIIHRIIAIDLDAKKVQTQGDNRVTNPIWEEVSFSGIKAVATRKIEKVGSPLRFMQTSTGFALLVILPLAVLVIFEVVILVRYILKHNKEKMRLELEEEREKLKQELLDELKNKEE